jgi:uncharacterized membrane protein YdbT with pleckstrin-like domain
VTTVPEWVSLDDGEEVQWVGQPATETMYGTVATGVLLTPFGVGLLILLAAPLAYLGIENTDYVVTTNALYVRKGILSTNIETVDLDRIQNTEFSESFWGKQFGYGKISISTAGSSGSEITFRGIPDAKSVRDGITELRQQRGRGAGVDGASESAEPSGASASADQVRELIEEVRATREAFERVAAELEDGDAAPGDGAAATDGDASEEFRWSDDAETPESDG